jgi:uncharacterized protein YprB with RNaseH-like and TPR domain
MKRVLIWDLETTGLQADFGTILCVGYKWLGEKDVHIISLPDYKGFRKDPTNDKPLVKDFLKIYNSADLTIAYNGVNFDRPYLLAKVMEHGLQVPPNVPMQDPYWTVRSNLRISRKSLANVTALLGLEKRKTPVEGKVWKRAMAGHADSIRYIVKHCRRDVEVLEETYLRLRPLMRTHHRLSDDLGQCRYCTSDKLHSKGRQVTKLKGEARRVQCQKCGSWDTRSAKEVHKYRIPKLRELQ